MYITHTYNLSDDICIYFTDSGPPPGSTDYTTLIVLHGTAFHCDSLTHLHTYAHAQNIRTVILNRREYPGSTPYTDAEIDDLVHGRKVFLDRLGTLLGDFLKTFIENETIPEMDMVNRTGGIAIMGWSAGNMTGMSLFSDPDLLDDTIYKLLRKYVRGLVLYDPAHSVFGYPPPQISTLYNPFIDPEFQGDPKEKFRNFSYWVASYYDHDLSQGPAGYDRRKRTENNSIANWSDEDFAKYCSVDAAIRSEQTCDSFFFH
ncbi:hypothetical protein K435DRAFT_821187 [Dendrothele bispora CBS 962.96]|uniref:AB hydrolase-1 domain-containing protein n=1 Tax=Dendrothele bispora (strain CBS 962.96) TaxID=1314807 RepID=A0A4S8LMM8_DENBC|nr:hypothetical protein K435DRAFT_821187 [Dendrothele bispora CBS 962.96]